MSTYIDRKKLPFKLLVEGKDDLFVVASIRDKHRLDDNFEIIDCQGVDKIADQLTAQILRQRPTVDVIGVLLDADADLQARWDSIRQVLLGKSYQVTASPDSNGTLITGDGRNPTIGIWLMPDNETTPGMLEHFVEQLIPADDRLHVQAQHIIATIEQQGINRYPLIHQKKALIHTWLAWQEEPGKPMGTAITATYLNHDADLCLRFVAWLNRLFNTP